MTKREGTCASSLKRTVAYEMTPTNNSPSALRGPIPEMPDRPPFSNAPHCCQLPRPPQSSSGSPVVTDRFCCFLAAAASAAKHLSFQSSPLPPQLDFGFLPSLRRRGCPLRRDPCDGLINHDNKGWKSLQFAAPRSPRSMIAVRGCVPFEPRLRECGCLICAFKLAHILPRTPRTRALSRKNRQAIRIG